MGCNSSRQEDVRRDRERVPHRAPQQRKAASSSTHPQEQKDPLNGHHSAPSGVDVPRTTAQEIAPASNDAADASTVNAGGDAGTDEAVYGSSYTNRRTKELDLLHDIVRHTRGAFIDVAQRPQQIHEEDITERSTIYSKHIQLIQQQPTPHHTTHSATPAPPPSSSLLSSTLLSHTSAVPSLFALPVGGGAGDVEGWSKGVVSIEEREWVTAVAREVTSAIEGARLKDVGKIVLSFEEL